MKNKNLKGLVVKSTMGLVMGALMITLKPVIEQEVLPINDQEVVIAKELPIRIISHDNRTKEVFYFNTKDVSMTSNLVGVEDMKKMLAGTELESLAEAFIELEDKYGVNAIFVASIACVESGYGRSNIAQNYNNITSIMKRDGSPVYFDSKYECLEYTYKLLNNHYIDPNGNYYNGLGVYDINELYCPDDNYHWANTVTAVMDRLISKL